MVLFFEPTNEPQFDRLRALKKLTQSASVVEIVTSRIAASAVFPKVFPFLPEYHARRLESFFSPSTVLVKASLTKLTSTNSLYYAEVVKNHASVVFVGSGIIGAFRYQRILDNIKRQSPNNDVSHVTVISTGHVFL